MGQREEVCKLANEIAKERGGLPYQYMGEAWEKIRQKQGLSTKRVPIKATKPSAAVVYDDDIDIDEDWDESSDDYDYARPRKSFGRGIGSGLKGVIKKSIKATADSVNFAKAPKDSPGEVFKRHDWKRTDPIPKIGLKISQVDPIPKIPEPLKRMFKIW